MPITQVPASQEGVMVFYNEREIKGNFVVLGIVEHSDLGKFQRLTLADALPPLKAKAREAGANGLIIDKEEVVYSGIISRGISVRARAINF